MSYFSDVQRYRRKLGLSPRQLIALVSEEVFVQRMSFLHEEVDELMTAQAAGDLPKVADAIADATCILLGIADLMGLPFDEVWDEVIRSNMDKDSVANQPGAKADERAYSEGVFKPEGWRPPDVAGVLRRASSFERAWNMGPEKR